MTYTPVELRHVRLGRSVIGYNRSSVDKLLEEVADSFESTWRERGQLADRVETLEKETHELRRREELLAHALVAAEQAARGVRDQAGREAEVILGEARHEARSVLRAAEETRDHLQLESRRIESMLRAALVIIDPDEPALRRSEPVATPAREEPALPAVEVTPEPAEEPPRALDPPAHLAAPRQAPSPEPRTDAEASVEAPPSVEAEPAAASETPAEPAPGEHEPDGWPSPEETGQLPVTLPPVSDAAEPDKRTESTPFLRRIAGGGGRDFDWGE